MTNNLVISEKNIIFAADYDYIKEITNGVFSFSAPYRDIFQVKDCEWSVVYDLLHKLSYDSAEIDIKVKYEDFSEIEAPSTYEDIAKAIERGYIMMKASLRTDGTIGLTCFLEWDYGDGYGMDVKSLWAVIDKEGKFVRPFHVG